MMGKLERDVKRALETFIAEVTRSAERAVIEGVRSAFVRATPQADAAVIGTDVRVTDDRRAPTATDRTSVRARVLACIRENPGWDATQLGRSLSSFPSKLRRPLRELANQDAIRFEERPVGPGGARRQVYFVSEPANGAHACVEPATASAEPAAVAAGAMA
jgi:hypothetical protein